MKYNFKSLEPNNMKNLNVNKQFNSELEYSEILYIISTSIEEYRKKFNLTQKQLANKLKVSQEMVSKLESGNANISIKKLVNIWNILSDENYNFVIKLLNKITQKTQENYNRLYYNNYRCEFLLYYGDEIKEINTNKYKNDIYVKKYMYS